MLHLTALFFSAIAIAYDNAPVSKQPVEWQQPKIWIISSIMGILLAVGTWILRGTMFTGFFTGYEGANGGLTLTGGHGVVQNFVRSIRSCIYLSKFSARVPCKAFSSWK